MLLSVIIPVYNEESLISELVERVMSSAEKAQPASEVIVVDDGSSDNTLSLLIAAREKYKNLKIISLSRNFGLQAALQAGLEYALGDSIIVMDGDVFM